MFKYNKMSSKKISSVLKKLMNKNIEVQDRKDDIDYYDKGSNINLIRFVKNNKIDKTLVKKKK